MAPNTVMNNTMLSTQCIQVKQLLSFSYLVCRSGTHTSCFVKWIPLRLQTPYKFTGNLTKHIVVSMMKYCAQSGTRTRIYGIWVCTSFYLGSTRHWFGLVGTTSHTGNGHCSNYSISFSEAYQESESRKLSKASQLLLVPNLVKLDFF